MMVVPKLVFQKRILPQTVMAFPVPSHLPRKPTVHDVSTQMLTRIDEATYGTLTASLAASWLVELDETIPTTKVGMLFTGEQLVSYQPFSRKSCTSESRQTSHRLNGSLLPQSRSRHGCSRSRTAFGCLTRPSLTRKCVSRTFIVHSCRTTLGRLNPNSRASVVPARCPITGIIRRRIDTRSLLKSSAL
jgi:hypothetical protein